MQQENLAQHATDIGSYLMHGLQETFSKQKAVITVRGKGLMIGVELDRPCRDMMATGAKHGLLFNIRAKISDTLSGSYKLKSKVTKTFTGLTNKIRSYKGNECLIH